MASRFCWLRGGGVVVGTDVVGRFFTSQGVLKLSVGLSDDPYCGIC